MKKILIILAALVTLIVIIFAAAIASFDINKHRGEIEAALSRQTGRIVKLGGDIHIGLSTQGLTLAVRDVAFGNPSWASRPNMASMGLFDLKVGLLPLLSHHVAIDGLAIENADILLESKGTDLHNWDMQATSSSTQKTAASGAPARPSILEAARRLRSTSPACRSRIARSPCAAPTAK